MVYICKGVCNSMKGEKVTNGSKYEYGQKRCTMCGIFMAISGFRCPCCSALLRTKSRNKKNSKGFKLL